MNWLTISGTAVLTFLVCFGLHSLDVWRIEAANVAALAAQKTELVGECDKNKQLSEGVSHDYQNQLAALNSQLDGLRKRTACVPIAADPAGHIGASGGAKPVREGAIYDLAGEGEKYRIQLRACQDFVTKTWQLNAH